jgi:hypothetical protein
VTGYVCNNVRLPTKFSWPIRATCGPDYHVVRKPKFNFLATFLGIISHRICE